MGAKVRPCRLQNFECRAHQFSNDGWNFACRKQRCCERKLGSNHATFVAKCFKTVMAMRIADTRIVNASKGEVALQELH